MTWHSSSKTKKKRQVRPSAATGASPAAALPIGDATDALCSSPSYDGVLWAMKNHQLCFFGIVFCIFHLSFFGCEQKMQSSSLWPVLWLKFSGVVGPVLPSLSLRDDNRSSSVSEWASVNPIDCGSVSRHLDIVDDNDR
jgi:hypothetical protein